MDRGNSASALILQRQQVLVDRHPTFPLGLFVWVQFASQLPETLARVKGRNVSVPGWSEIRARASPVRAGRFATFVRSGLLD